MCDRLPALLWQTRHYCGLLFHDLIYTLLNLLFMCWLLHHLREIIIGTRLYLGFRHQSSDQILSIWWSCQHFRGTLPLSLTFILRGGVCDNFNTLCLLWTPATGLLFLQLFDRDGNTAPCRLSFSILSRDTKLHHYSGVGSRLTKRTIRSDNATIGHTLLNRSVRQKLTSVYSLLCLVLHAFVARVTQTVLDFNSTCHFKSFCLFLFALCKQLVVQHNRLTATGNHAAAERQRQLRLASLPAIFLLAHIVHEPLLQRFLHIRTA